MVILYPTPVAVKPARRFADGILPRVSPNRPYEPTAEDLADYSAWLADLEAERNMDRERREALAEAEEIQADRWEALCRDRLEASQGLGSAWGGIDCEWEVTCDDATS